MTSLVQTYTQMSGMHTEHYQHATINHSYNFVNPATGVHTQNIESMWKHVKDKLKRGNGTSSGLFDSGIYVAEEV